MAFSIFTDEELDQLLLTASHQYEDEEEEQRLGVKYQDMQEEEFTLDSLLADVPKQREEVKQAQDQASNKENFARFTAPVTEADIVKKIHGSIPKATRKSTGWAVHTWEVWAENRQKTSAEFTPKLSVITDKQLNYWLSRFVLEVRSKKGEQYQGGTLLLLNY